MQLPTTLSMDLDDTCSSVDRDGEVTLRSPWGTNS
ncbi:unnamed protein product, partial [Choristocarpus tenellus]